MRIHKSRLEQLLREAYQAGSEDRRVGVSYSERGVVTNYKLLEDRYIQTVEEINK